MNPSLIFTLILVFGILGLCLYTLYKRNKRGYPADECDPQLLMIHEFLNQSFTDLLGRLTHKIEDHFETEYGDNAALLEEEAGKHMRMVTDFNAWVSNVSTYPGWPVHITSIHGDEEGSDYYAPWTIVVATAPAEHREFKIPQQNIAYLIDRLADLNDYNEQLISMVMKSQQ